MLKELMQKKADIEAQMIELQESIAPRLAELREEAAGVMVSIGNVISPKLLDLRKLQAKEFGTVNLTLDGFKVTEVIDKKIEWDQVKLSALFDRISASGDNPRAYMKVKLEIGEKEYKAFPAGLQQIFGEARTVKPGNPKLSFEEVPNA